MSNAHSKEQNTIVGDTSSGHIGSSHSTVYAYAVSCANFL